MALYIHTNIDEVIITFLKKNLKGRRGIIIITATIIAISGMVFAAATIDKPYTFFKDDVIRAEEVNQNFDKLYAKINELAVNVQGVPVGTIVPFGGIKENIPNGWRLCDGSTLSKNEYPALFDAIGFLWGGDGISQFKLPDLQGYFLRGANNNTGADPDAGARTFKDGTPFQFGQVPGSYQIDAFQGHRHSVYYSMCFLGGSANIDNGSWGTFAFSNDPIGDAISGSYGAIRQSIETRPKNAAVNYIIKIQ